ncbi:N-6 DNA methylase [Bacteroides ovatus]|uniref:N-6 DNA methylase n=1 Tax=Bacteroides ovatus TaxID=28116 RepID=UPI00189DDFD5|nr:N-6 DNA methylase [Bacteroides ovatus]
MISKEFQQYYTSISYCKDRSEVFIDFLDYCLYILSAGMIREEYIRLEKKYQDTELTTFKRMLEIVADQSEGFKDALGDLFMQHVSHGHNGQFFTPMHVSDFMASILSTDELKKNDSICDPTCGSGRMLLSATKQCVNKSGERPQCFGSDIDLNCVKMCTINMILNSIPGEIAWMDTLTMKHWRSYHIKLILIYDMWFPSLTVTGAGETNFILRLEKTLKEKPGLTEQIKKNIEARQLTIDF